jgi:hypothetical protein
MEVGDTVGHTSRDNEIQTSTEVYISEAIASLNNNNHSLSSIYTKMHIGSMVESLCLYHKAGGNPDNLSLCSRINNLEYFLVIREQFQEVKHITLTITIDSNNSNSFEPGNPGSGENTNNGNDQNSSTNINESSNFSILERILVSILSLFSYAIEILIELLNNFY